RTGRGLRSVSRLSSHVSPGRDAARRDVASRAGGASAFRSGAAAVLRRGRKTLAWTILTLPGLAARRTVPTHLALFRAAAGALRDPGNRPAVVVAPADTQLHRRLARRLAGRKTGFRGSQRTSGRKPLLAHA